MSFLNVELHGFSLRTAQSPHFHTRSYAPESSEYGPIRPGCKVAKSSELCLCSVGKSPAHDAPNARLKEVRHLGLAEAVLVPVAPDVTDVVDDAAVTRDE